MASTNASSSAALVERPYYRTSRHKDPAVLVYTINQESRYLKVSNVPHVGSATDIVKLFALYGTIEEWRYLDNDPDSTEYTDVYWFRYSTFAEARLAKKKMDEFVYLTVPLVVTYAPMFETVADTRLKLENRRKLILDALQQQKRRPLPPTSKSSQSPAMPMKGLVKGKGYGQAKTMTSTSSFDDPLLSATTFNKSNKRQTTESSATSSSTPQYPSQYNASHQDYYSSYPYAYSYGPTAYYPTSTQPTQQSEINTNAGYDYNYGYGYGYGEDYSSYNTQAPQQRGRGQ